LHAVYILYSLNVNGSDKHYKIPEIWFLNMAIVTRWKFVVIVGILILSAGLKLIISGVI